MIYKKDYFGFVYKWDDLVNGMSYIGSHYGPTTGYYKGSNIRFLRAIKKRPNDFIRTILEYVQIDDKKSVLDAEQRWLDLVPNIKDNKNFYNQKNEACGGWSFITTDHIKQRSQTYHKRFQENNLTEGMLTMNIARQKTRKERWNTVGFSPQEKSQHEKYGYKLKIILPDSSVKLYNSCAEASKSLGIDARYGLVVCKTKDTFKGYRIMKIQDPVIDCRKKGKNDLI